MVTILPIDIDQDLVREGVQYAVAERLAAKLRTVDEVIAALRRGDVVARQEWDRVFTDLANGVADATPVLEYAESFFDETSEPADG